MSIDSIHTTSTVRKTAAKFVTNVGVAAEQYEDLQSIGDSAIEKLLPPPSSLKKQVIESRYYFLKLLVLTLSYFYLSDRSFVEI